MQMSSMSVSSILLPWVLPPADEHNIMFSDETVSVKVIVNKMWQNQTENKEL